MRIRTFGRWALLLPVALAALMLVGCGDDDSGGSSSGGGSSGGSSSGGSSSSGSGSDAAYVGELCKATLKFTKSIDAATKDPSKLSNPDELLKAVLDPLEQFAKDIAKANPPKDAKDYHEKAVAAINTAVAKMKKDKSLTDLSDLQDPFPEPPKDISDRLTKVANANKDCVDSHFDFGGK